MRTALLTALLAGLVGAGLLAQTGSVRGPAAAAADLRPIGTMRELMAFVIRPASDAVFYITSRTPESGEAWLALQGQALALAEAGTILMLPAHARGRAQWLADARLMREAGRKAFAAAKAKDVAALEALNDELYTSCTTCHERMKVKVGGAD
ncbi:MAG: hypothetical protein AB7O28_27425 [Vicinamibacterales bacterium]